MHPTGFFFAAHTKICNILASQFLFSNNTLAVTYTNELAYGTYEIKSPWANTLIGNALRMLRLVNKMTEGEDIAVHNSCTVLCLIALFSFLFFPKTAHHIRIWKRVNLPTKHNILTVRYLVFVAPLYLIYILITSLSADCYTHQWWIGLWRLETAVLFGWNGEYLSLHLLFNGCKRILSWAWSSIFQEVSAGQEVVPAGELCASLLM